MENNEDDIVDLRFDSAEKELNYNQEEQMKDHRMSPQLPPIRIKSDLVIAESQPTIEPHKVASNAILPFDSNQQDFELKSQEEENLDFQDEQQDLFR